MALGGTSQVRKSLPPTARAGSLSRGRRVVFRRSVHGGGAVGRRVHRGACWKVRCYWPEFGGLSASSKAFTGDAVHSIQCDSHSRAEQLGEQIDAIDSRIGAIQAYPAQGACARHVVKTREKITMQQPRRTRLLSAVSRLRPPDAEDVG